MSAPIPVLINRSGGTAKSLGDKLAETVTAAFEKAGIAIDLHLVEGKDIATTAKKLSSAPVVVVGGGDGTLGGAAQQLVDGGGAALGILPLGTRNHLARELGIAMELDEAVAAIAEGHQRKIDLARVADRVFVNNASIGFYPELVNERDDRALPKLLATLPATFAVLKRMRYHRLRLTVKGREEPVVTPMLFIGNNKYELGGGRLGQRATLDDGVLSIYAIASRRRLALILFAIRTLFGRAGKHDFAAIGEVPTLEVSGASRSVDVALDGEVVTLAMPLKFTIAAKALTVVAPPLEPKAAPA